MPADGNYVPDYRLRDAYEEASRLDAGGIEALCPSYLEVTGPGPRYENEVLLGRGSSKEVFRAYDNRMKRWIALARLRPDCGPETYDHFIHEAWLTSSLAHPNIIGIHDLGVDEQGRPFFTMDLKGETTLAVLISARVPPPLTERLGILIKVCDAMASAHARRTLHLDLKPENIQADAFGEVLVCDWGLGSVMRGHGQDGPVLGPAGAEEHDSHSLTGEIRGTPGYMAPEQAVPGSAVDERTDVFALGCLLHALLTGEPPVRGGTRDEQLERTREARFASPRRDFPGHEIPPALEAVFHKATARDPAGRYPSVAALRGELAKHLAGYATAAEQAGFFREAGLFLRRNRAAAAASLLGLVALTVISVRFIQKLDSQRKLTVAERVKSTTLAGDVTRLEELYATQSTEFRQSARELALSIATAADALKNIGIFADPLKAVGEASEMATMALTLDPGCDEARLQQLDLHCHTLDFKAALASPRIAEGHPRADYLAIAAVAPDFDYSATRRPAAAELAGFLQRAREVGPPRPPLMERIVCYDYTARTRHDGYQDVVAALLSYVNRGWDESGFRYDPGTRALHLEAGDNFRLSVPPGGGSGYCLLRFIPVRELDLDSTGPVDLGGLNALGLETLDLRGCASIRCTKVARLPLLRTIRVRKGSFDRSLAGTLLISAGQIEIVEEP